MALMSRNCPKSSSVVVAMAWPCASQAVEPIMSEAPARFGLRAGRAAPRSRRESEYSWGGTGPWDAVKREMEGVRQECAVAGRRDVV